MCCNRQKLAFDMPPEVFYNAAIADLTAVRDPGGTR
jgi:hypothetical protein